MIGLAQLLWAINLHVLHLLGLDVAWILDFRDPSLDDLELTDTSSNHRNRLAVPGSINKNEGRNLYMPVYKLFILYSGWVGVGWLLFLSITGRDRESMESYRWFVALIALGAGVGALAPWKGIGERERLALRR